jgi:hypothetical protein
MRMKGRLLLSLAMMGTACTGHSPVPRPDGRAEINASQQVMSRITSFTINSTSTTNYGAFHTAIEVDCARKYYHMEYVVDLTPEGIEKKATTFDGRPRAHQKTEQLFVGGRPYMRYSGTWESPDRDDSKPSFTRVPNSGATDVSVGKSCTSRQ